MSPVRSDNAGASYSWQVLICLGLIVGVSIAMGSYIVHLNARIDKQRELSPVYLHQCGNGRGGFIVYPDGRRSSDDCYPADDLESTSTDQPQDVPGTPREQWLKYILHLYRTAHNPDNGSSAGTLRPPFFLLEAPWLRWHFFF